MSSIIAGLIAAGLTIQPCWTDQSTDQKQVILVVNGGFEEGQGSPDSWKTLGNFAGIEYLWERASAHQGQSSIGFNKTRQDYLAIAQWVQPIEYDGKAKAIEVSAWVKAEKATKAVLDVQFVSHAGESSHKWAAYIGAANAGDPPAHHDWKQYKGIVNIPDGTKSVRVSLQIYGPGKVWFDDVEARWAEPVKEVEEPQEARPPRIKFEGNALRAGDEQKHFFYFEPKVNAQPKAGYKLLLVLPGGDGQAEFNPFVASIRNQAIPDDFVVAQLVAPQWSKEQAENFVWPVKAANIQEAKFTTEEFINAVIEEVRKKVEIDPRGIFALAWSSSGSAVYSATLMENSPVTGAFMAMSVFQPPLLPKLDGAKGKAFYLLQSPDDQVTLFSHAQKAQEELAAKGAKVKLVEYPGGHGWTMPDRMASIRDGIAWLEKTARQDQ
jgi:predicted esterase